MNESKNQKITLFQALLIFIVAIYNADMRFIPSSTSSVAHQAGWLVTICSMVIYVPFLYMLFKVVKKFEGQSLHDILCKVFGKILGKAVSVLFLVWLVILLGFYIKYTGENLVTTEFIGTDMNLLIFIALFLVAIMLRWGVSVLARMNKVIFVIILTQFIIILFFLFLHFKPEYVTPVSTLDIVPVASSVIYPLTIFAYITPVFIFNDQIQYDNKSWRKFAFSAGFITVVNTALMLALLGMLDYHLIEKLKLPLYTAVENISVFKSSSGLDSLFISVWVLAEYVNIAFLGYCASRLIKNIFGLKSQIPALTAILGFMFFFAAFFANDLFEMVNFSKNIAPYMNLSMGLAVPVIIFITAKIRKMV